MLQDVRLAAQTTHSAMGTVMTHKAFGSQAEEALAAACREIAYLEDLLSRFLPNSEISRINESAGFQNVKVSPETFAVLSKSVEFSRRCVGCFDITIEPLVSLWSMAKQSSTTPDDYSIQQVLPLVNFRDLTLDPWKMTAGLKNIGQSVDLGGIGKGFAGDKILEVYRQFGVGSAYSNLGGNVVTLGAKPDGSPWKIGIQHPREENQIVGCVSVVNETVVTSGDYQRYYTDQMGIRRHHILNPKTGYPADSGLVSVTVVAEKSIAADALSTILFVAGLEKGLDYLRSFPKTEAIFIDKAMQVYITQGLRNRFQAEEGIDLKILDGMKGE